MEDEEILDIEEQSDDKSDRKIVKNAVDLQRLKIEKLMKNPDKPIIIPEIPKEKDFVYSVPTFVRNVMGSSAGAGSGEFHVYRNLRRKEYARQKIIEMKSFRENLDQDYRDKIERNRLEAEAKTAKKRAKRLKKKKNQKRNKKTKPNEKDAVSNEPDFTESEEDSDEEKKDDKQSDTTLADKNDMDMESSQTYEIQTVENKPDENSDKIIELNQNSEKNSNENSELKLNESNEKSEEINKNAEKESTENSEEISNENFKIESNEKSEKQSIEISEDLNKNTEKELDENSEKELNEKPGESNGSSEEQSSENLEKELNNCQEETVKNNEHPSEEKLNKLDVINSNLGKSKDEITSKDEISNENN